MKILRKIAITVSLTVLCVVMMLSSVSAHTFTDVTRYGEAIGLLSTLEVIKGYSETRFGPDDEVTRWQMALLISKLVTGNVETSTWEANDNSSSFTDVRSNHYFGSIAYAHRNGIIIGRNEETFAPEDPITLQDGLTMVVRALGYPSAALNAGYPDSYIDKGRELGLLTDITNLGYTANMTRGHTAQLLYNALYAGTYSGSTLAETAFEIVERTIVLTATENMKINTNVSYARSGTLIFSQMDAYGRITDAFTLDASLFNLRTPNEYLGVAYKIVATEDFSIILDIQQVSKFLTESKTSNLTANSNNRTITLGDGVYEPVAGYRTYKIEDNVVPTGTKEIIIYGMNNVFNTQGTVVMINDIAGTNGYYSMTAFDDNDDGFIDRALYFPYSFGQYIVDSSNKVAIAGGESTSAITFTGLSVRNEDYVIYSYNPQSKTLDIMKVLEVKEGTINQTEYTSAQGTVKLGDTSYNIGRSDVKGVMPKSDLEKPLIGTASGTLNGRTFKYVADGIYVYVYTLGDAVSNTNTSNTYGTNIGVVTSISAFNSTYGYTVTLNNSTALPIVAVDGVAVNSYLAPLNKGDIIQYEVYQTSANMTTYRAIKINTAPTYNTTISSASMYASNSVLYVSENSTVAKSYALTSVTPIYYLDSNMNLTVYTASTFSERTVSTYYSIFVAYDTYLANSIAAIYIKPFDSNSMVTTGEYNKIVYISSDSINTSVAGQNYRTYSALDLMTGTTISVTLHYATLPGVTAVTSAGYYRVYNDIITNTYPITESSLSSSYITMVRGVTLASITNITNTESYFYTVNNVAFSTNINNLYFYVREGSSISGHTLKRYAIDSTEFVTFVNSANLKSIDVIYNKNQDFFEGTYYGSVVIIVN